MSDARFQGACIDGPLFGKNLAWYHPVFRVAVMPKLVELKMDVTTFPYEGSNSTFAEVTYHWHNGYWSTSYG